ncbi:MAG TPA: molybdopterin dinucleotide binding domain-containing protein, partial [Methylomirabilota bacterium]|nr:molybdopterin dinucleotide binding domain-containing protein [Methylomirabilota bacterium]
ELHPADADRLQIRDADLVEVETDIGAVVVRALITPRQRPGSVFVPMHWSAQFASNAGVGRLYPPVTDPVSGQPALKYAGASVRRVAASVYGFAVSREPTHPAADYFARAACPQGWRTELACLTPIDDPAAFARALFALDPAADVLAYADRQAGSHRVAAFAGDRLVGALFLSASPVEVSRTWAVSQLAADHGDLRARYRVIAGRAAGDRPEPGALVCSCFGVGANQVAAAAMSGARTVAEVGRVLQAGTNCGSCRSEIASILCATGLAAAE